MNELADYADVLDADVTNDLAQSMFLSHMDNVNNIVQARKDLVKKNKDAGKEDSDIREFTSNEIVTMNAISPLATMEHPLLKDSLSANKRFVDALKSMLSKPYQESVDAIPAKLDADGNEIEAAVPAKDEVAYHDMDTISFLRDASSHISFL